MYNDGFGMPDEDVANASSRFSSKRLIKISEPGTKAIRLLRGPFSADRVWWPTVRLDEESGGYKVIMMSANRPDEGWVFDSLASRHVKLLKASGEKNAYSPFSARKVWRFTAFERDGEEDPNQIRVLEVKKRLYDQILGYRNAVSTRNPGVLAYGPIWSYDFNIVTSRDKGKVQKFGTTYSAQPMPPQPLAGKIAVADRGKAWTIDELAESGCFIDGEIASLRSPDFDPTQDLQPKTNAELLDTLKEYPIYLLHHGRDGDPYYEPAMIRDLAKSCENLQIEFIGKKVDIGAERAIEHKPEEAQAEVMDSRVPEADQGPQDAPVRGSRRRGAASGAPVSW